MICATCGSEKECSHLAHDARATPLELAAIRSQVQPTLAPQAPTAAAKPQSKDADGNDLIRRTTIPK